LKERRKGFINFIELIVVAVVVITAFSVFFPGVGYKSEWDSAELFLRGRDVMFTVDSIGKLHEYSFDSDSFNNFLTTVFSGTNLITWDATKEAVKTTIKVSCVCDNEQIDALNDWLLGFKVNGRPVEFIIYQSDISSIVFSDALIIWGDDMDLSSYRSQIEDFLASGGGAIEIMDFRADVGDVQQDIFGITNGGGWGNDVNIVVKPNAGNQLTYQAYKLFYNQPYRIVADTSSGTTAACTQSNMTGTFTVRGTPNQFWICDGTSVHFDTNGDGGGDTGALHAGDTFTIDGFNFRVAYVESETQARISFDGSTDYEFVDFIRKTGIEIIRPSDDDYSRSFVVRTGALPQKSCGVVLNNASGWRTVWMANFTEDGIDVGDDLKHLLTSLLIWASNKDETTTITNLRVGYVTSFVNIYERDLVEIYKLDFGLGYPY
jgi:hypothetical protein